MKKKIKVMHIVQAPGGVERYILSLFRSFDRSKVHNILICSNDYLFEKFEGLVDDFENVEMNRSINAFRDLLAVKTVRKLIKKYMPDIIYCHSSKAGAIGRIANIGIEKKCIYNPHGWAFNMNCSKLKQFIYANIERFLAKQTDIIVCISEAEKKSALQWRIFAKNRTVVIYNGIDLTEDNKKQYSITKEQLNIPSEAYVIGCVGRLSEQKSPDVYAQAAVQIKQYLPNAFFLMVGDGELKERVIQIFEKNNMEKDYLITGWVNNPMEYINLFDIAVLLSRWEGFGLVLAEYMLAEKPIIATNVDAIPYIIEDGVNGILVEKDSIMDVCQSVLNLYENTELYNQIKKNEISIVRDKYDIIRVAKEHQSLFEEVLWGNS